MALTTYNELITAVQNWCVRTDEDFVNRIPDFITLFESEANRRLKVRQQEASTTITMSSGSGTLPTDFLAWRKVVWPGSTRRNLEYVDPVYMEETYPDQATGVPAVFTIEGTSIKVAPLDDTSLTFLYYQKVAALSGAVNWLFTGHPDLYLFGTLVEATAYNMDAEKAVLWKARRDELFDGLIRLDQKYRGPAQIRAQGFYTP